MFSNFFSENRAVYEIMSKNMVKVEKRLATRRMRFVYWISKAKSAQAHVRARSNTPTPTTTRYPARTPEHEITPPPARTHTHIYM